MSWSGYLPGGLMEINRINSRKVSTRYHWWVQQYTTGFKIELTCKAKGKILDKDGVEIDNPRSPEVGAKTFFWLANSKLDEFRLWEHMASLTDDQCDSFFPQAPVKKNKKAKAE